ncbi:MAG: hypothetical protein JEZ10_09645, partial [Verrucomicrobia bacterium]|nr:hypothetical protein [Verrucomicrobiota bacterium]
MKKLMLLVLMILPLLSSGGLFNEYAEKATTGTYTFEEAAQIENWDAVNGSVAISEKRAKDGQRSGLWKWEPGGYLLMNNPEGLTRACEPYEGGSPEQYERKYVAPGLEGGVKMWVYNETPSPDGQLFLQVGHDAKSVLENPRYKISVSLNFQGWRAIWVHFDQDAKVEGYA